MKHDIVFTAQPPRFLRPSRWEWTKAGLVISWDVEDLLAWMERRSEEVFTHALLATGVSRSRGDSHHLGPTGWWCPLLSVHNFVRRMVPSAHLLPMQPLAI